MNKYFFIFFTFILSQGLNTNTNYYDRVEQEVDVLLETLENKYFSLLDLLLINLCF